MNPFQPLKNGKNRLLSEGPGTVPDVSGGVLNYMRPMQLINVVKETVNMQLVETPITIDSVGFIQPGKQSLRMKPEGQRRWKPWTLFTIPAVILQPDSIVTIVNLRAGVGNTSYRVMGKKDWSEAGYIEYDLEEDYS